MLKLALLFCICLSLLFGCTVPTRVIVFNGSGDVITLAYKKNRVEQVQLLVPPNGSVEVKGLLDHDFYVVSKSHVYSYPILSPPESFINNVGFGPFFKRILKVGFFDDLCIYLISVEAGFKNADDQPKGFPLCPESSELSSGA